ncbi:MAG: hypothetical protein QW815_09370 [Nitrososphaerota archaeon]
MDSVVLELSDIRSTGRGRYSGKAVATCLYRYATPILKYQVGDIVEVVDSE